VDIGNAVLNAAVQAYAAQKISSGKNIGIGKGFKHFKACLIFSLSRMANLREKPASERLNFQSELARDCG